MYAAWQKRYTEVHLIHIHTVVMKEPVTCFWVLIPPRLFVVSEWGGRSREEKTSVTVMRVCVLIRRVQIVCVWASHTQMWLVGEHTICVCAWTRASDWLCACVFAPRECVFEKQYLRAAGSPKASTLHPWLGSTGDCLQSANSPETEERRTDTVATLLAFICFLLPSFVLLF